jgi:hypothetical protein
MFSEQLHSNEEGIPFSEALAEGGAHEERGEGM